MEFHQSKKTDFSHAYLEAREEVDELCRSIVLRAITPEEAIDSYDRIETLYAKNEPSDFEFFRRIYRSRVLRLIDQFIPGNEE